MERIALVMNKGREGAKMIPLYLRLIKNNTEVILLVPQSNDGSGKQLLKLLNVYSEACYQFSDGCESDMFYDIHRILTDHKPTTVIVDGSCESDMLAAMAARTLNLNVVYCDAGRKKQTLIAKVMAALATTHVTTLSSGATQCKAQGISQDSIVCAGSLGVDLIKLIQAKTATHELEVLAEIIEALAFTRAQGYKRILFHVKTLEHERKREFIEAFGQFLEDHPNHALIAYFEDEASLPIFNHERFFACNPSLYHDKITLISSCDVIITDTAEVQQEALWASKPVVYISTSTDCHEGLWAHMVQLISNDPEKIFNACYVALKNSPTLNLYGTGNAACKIAEAVVNNSSTVYSKKHEKEFGFY